MRTTTIAPKQVNNHHHHHNHPSSKTLNRAMWVVLALALSTTAVCVFVLCHLQVNEQQSEVTDDTPLGQEDNCVTLKPSSLATFDRPVSQQCEGYWRPLKVPPKRKYTTAAAAAPAGLHQAEAVELLSWPSANTDVFCGQTEWLRRLEVIEKVAEIATDVAAAAAASNNNDRRKNDIGGAYGDLPSADAAGVPVVGGHVGGQAIVAEIGSNAGLAMSRFRGLTNSRIDGSFLGNKEFHDSQGVSGNSVSTSHRQSQVSGGPSDDPSPGTAGATTTGGGVHPGAAAAAGIARARPGGASMCWTGDFGSHYVGEHNVRPSRQFYMYVIAKYSDLKEAGIEDAE